MKENKELPEILIVAEDGYVTGIEEGIYPELKEKLDLNKEVISVCDSEEVKEKKYILKSKPNLTNGTFYMLNKFSGSYIDLSSPDLIETLENDKLIAYRESLVRLGAKNIKIERAIDDETNKEFSLNAKASKDGVAGGEIDVDKSNYLSIKYSSVLESDLKSRKPKAPKQVIDYLEKKGLDSDSNLYALYERLKEDGRIEGKEKIKIQLKKEIKDALKICLDLDIPLYFKANVGLSIKSQNIHTLSLSVDVDFGSVAEENKHELDE